MMKRFVMVAGLSLVLGACGGGDDAADGDDVGGGLLQEEMLEELIEEASDQDVDVDIETDDDGGLTITFEDEDESGQVGVGSDLPAGFPFPVPDDHEVMSSFEIDQENGKAYSAVIHTPEADFDDVAALYEGFLEDEGFEVSMDNLSGDTGKFVFLSGDRSDARVDITMSIEEVANGVSVALVSLTWTPQ